MRRYSGGDTLAAPGILRNPVPVRALFDRRTAHRATLRNLLQREGYEDLASVLRAGARKGKAEGKIEGKIEGKVEGKVEALAEALFRVLAARGFDVDAETRAHIDNCRKPEQLGAWLTKATIADKPGKISFDGAILASMGRNL